jgi:hypothetical protein
MDDEENPVVVSACRRQGPPVSQGSWGRSPGAFSAADTAPSPAQGSPVFDESPVLTQTRSLRRTVEAASDSGHSPSEAMDAMYCALKTSLCINVQLQSLTLNNRNSEAEPDECVEMLNDIANRRHAAMKRVSDEYAARGKTVGDAEVRAALGEVSARADRCQKLVWYWEVARRAVRSALSLDDGDPWWDPSGRDLPASLGMKTIKELHDDKTLSVYNQCVLYIQECFKNEDLRRHDGAVFEKVKNSADIMTIAWKRVHTIRQYIFKHINQNVRPDLWTAVTRVNTVDQLEQYYVESENPSFPALKKNRNMFSFDDGVYDARSGEFHRYSEMSPTSEVRKYCAARHFTKPFPGEHYAGPGDISRWRDIPTLGVRKVFEYQGLSCRDETATGLKADSVEDWFYRLVGRMFFEIGELDDFQVFIYLLGRAGTGKSTLAHYAAAGVYEDEDVKQGDNMIERQFGLWPLIDALIVKFTEVKANFQLDQAQLQEMVSGGSVAVARKNLKAAHLSKWSAHLVMCGNEMPGYQDRQGSLRRRYVIFNMTRKVVEENADLKKTMTADMPCFIMKCAMAYRELVTVMGIRAGIWNHLPKHFHDNADSIDDNSLKAFMRSDRVRLSVESKVPETCEFRDFKIEFAKFCREECLTRNVDLSSRQHYAGIFDDFEICVRREARDRRVFLDGVSIVYSGDNTPEQSPVGRGGGVDWLSSGWAAGGASGSGAAGGGSGAAGGASGSGAAGGGSGAAGGASAGCSARGVSGRAKKRREMTPDDMEGDDDGCD